LFIFEVLFQKTRGRPLNNCLTSNKEDYIDSFDYNNYHTNNYKQLNSSNNENRLNYTNSYLDNKSELSVKSAKSAKSFEKSAYSFNNNNVFCTNFVKDIKDEAFSYNYIPMLNSKEDYQKSITSLFDSNDIKSQNLNNLNNNKNFNNLNYFSAFNNYMEKDIDFDINNDIFGKSFKDIKEYYCNDGNNYNNCLLNSPTRYSYDINELYKLNNDIDNCDCVLDIEMLEKVYSDKGNLQ